jgi:hypothetical protein
VAERGASRLLDLRDILVDPDDDERGLAGLELLSHLLGVLARHAVREAVPLVTTAASYDPMSPLPCRALIAS